MHLPRSWGQACVLPSFSCTRGNGASRVRPLLGFAPLLSRGRWGAPLGPQVGLPCDNPLPPQFVPREPVQAGDT